MLPRLRGCVIAATSLAILCVLAGCSTRSMGTPTAVSSFVPPGPEAGAAAKMLLSRSEFPPGWAVQPATVSSAPARLNACTLAQAAGLTGWASTGAVSATGGSAFLVETVGIYRSPSSATASTNALRSAVKCFVKLVNSGQMNDAETSYGGATLASESFSLSGYHPVAYRVLIHSKSKVQVSGGEADVYIDVVSVAKGRAAMQVFAFDVFRPFRRATLQTVAQTAASRLSS